MPRPDPDEQLFQDPKASSTKGIINKMIVVATGLHDDTAGGGPLWAKAKGLKRGDVMALAGFGTTNAFNNWSMEDMEKVAQAVSLHCGKPYTYAKYVCCSCA